MAIPSIDLTIILPIVILVVTALAVLLLDAFSEDTQHSASAVTALTGVLLAAVFCALQAGHKGETLEGMAVLDGFGLSMELLLLGIAALSILLSISYLPQHNLNRGEYYVLMLFVTAGGMVMATSNDLITIFLGLELLSLSLYVLSAFDRARATSAEAGMKYLLLGGFASAFLLYGIALTFGATGSTNLTSIAQYFAQHKITGNPLPLIGLGLMLVGFGFKIAAAPFHAWVPDVYEGAPTSVTAFMSSAAKVAGFAALIRVLFFAFATPDLRVDWSGAVAILAVLTMTTGNVAALLQNNIKRMLAYSGIAHAGYILLAVVAGTQRGVQAAHPASMRRGRQLVAGTVTPLLDGQQRARELASRGDPTERPRLLALVELHHELAQLARKQSPALPPRGDDETTWGEALRRSGSERDGTGRPGHGRSTSARSA